MSDYSIPNLPLLPIAQDVPTESGYWQDGAQVPATATFTRWHRLMQYRDMYDGDWSGFDLRDLEVVDNYFASITDFWADLMLAYPPTLAPEDEALQADLTTALHECVVDYFRYGVALLYPYTEDDGQARVEAIDPRLWYPMPGGEGDVILRFIEGKYVDVLELPLEGSDVITRYEINERGGSTLRPADDAAALYTAQRVAPFACTLGQQVESNTAPATEGRSVYPIARRPTYGDWGSSIYPEIASLVFEFSRRASDIAVINSEHAYPLLTETGEPDAPNLGASLLDDRVTEGEAEDQDARRFRHNRRRGQRYRVPSGVGLEYVVWDASLDAQYEEMDRVQQSIFRMTDTPQTLFGINTDQTPNTPSGEALRRSYIPTYLKSRQLQVAFLKAVNGCLAALGLEATTVDWPEPLERIDNDTKGAAAAMMASALGGNSEGGVDGDAEAGEDDAEQEMDTDEPV